MKKSNKLVWLNTLLTIITTILLMVLIISVNKYGSLSKNIFIFINVIYLIIILAIILITVKVNNSQSKKPKIFYSVFLIFLMSISAYGLYLVSVVNINVKEITTESGKIEYTAAFVVYDSEINDLEQLKYKTLGIIESPEFIEGNILPKDELKKLEYDNVKFKTYESYTKLINALVKEEVDFVSLPADYRNLYSTNEELEPYLSKTKVIHTFSGSYENISKISGSNIDVTKVPFTALLMGNDGGRTDTLILASVNPKAMQLTLTSIARDSYVPIACYPGEARDKINHARGINRECTIKTVENLLDLSIDFFAEINFQGVVDLVDSLGTLTIDSPASFHGNIETGEGGGVFIPEGISELDGNQVLAFVRERDSFIDGDFQRQENQQQVIDSLLSKVIETRDVNKLINLVKATGRNVETNLSLSQLIDLMNLGIVKMESTYLNNADIFTIYGSRISGRGALLYSPDYEKEIYYYILYDGAVSDAKDFIAMNTRADGILEIPKGFNYSYNQEYRPPIFGEEEYYESIDQEIIDSKPQPEPENIEPKEEEAKPQPQADIEVVDFSGEPYSKLQVYADENGLVLEIISTEYKVTSEENLIGKTFVVDNNAGIFLNAGDSLRVSIVEYILEEELPEKEPEDPDDKKTDD